MNLAVKFVCEKVVKFLIGDESFALMMNEGKREGGDDVYF